MPDRAAESALDEPQGIPLVSLFFMAPLIGIRVRWPNVLHAVELDGIPFDPNGTCTSACGLKGLRIAVTGTTVALWPPYVKGLGEKKRCPECFAICKKKKPRSRFVRKEVAA